MTVNRWKTFSFASKIIYLEKGDLYFDVLNPSTTILSPKAKRLPPVCRFSHADGELVIKEDSSYDDATQIHYASRSIWYYASEGQSEKMESELNARCFFPQELDMLLHYNGFKMIEKYGNFDQKPFSSGDLKQIVVCEI